MLFLLISQGFSEDHRRWCLRTCSVNRKGVGDSTLLSMTAAVVRTLRSFPSSGGLQMSSGIPGPLPSPSFTFLQAECGVKNLLRTLDPLGIKLESLQFHYLLRMRER